MEENKTELTLTPEQVASARSRAEADYERIKVRQMEAAGLTPEQVAKAMAIRRFVRAQIDKAPVPVDDGGYEASRVKRMQAKGASDAEIATWIRNHRQHKQEVEQQKRRERELTEAAVELDRMERRESKPVPVSAKAPVPDKPKVERMELPDAMFETPASAPLNARQERRRLAKQNKKKLIAERIKQLAEDKLTPSERRLKRLQERERVEAEKKAEADKARQDLAGFSKYERQQAALFVAQNIVKWRQQYGAYVKAAKGKAVVDYVSFNEVRRQGRVSDVMQMVRYASKAWFFHARQFWHAGFISGRSGKTHATRTPFVILISVPAESIWEHSFVWNPLASKRTILMATEDVEHQIAAGSSAVDRSTVEMWKGVLTHMQTCNYERGFAFVIQTINDVIEDTSKETIDQGMRYGSGVCYWNECTDVARIAEMGSLKTPTRMCGGCGWYVLTAKGLGCGYCTAGFCSKGCKRIHQREKHPECPAVLKEKRQQERKEMGEELHDQIEEVRETQKGPSNLPNMGRFDPVADELRRIRNARQAPRPEIEEGDLGLLFSE